MVTAGQCRGRRPLQQWPDKPAAEISRKKLAQKIGAKNLTQLNVMRMAAQKLERHSPLMGSKKRDTRHYGRTRKSNGLMLAGTEPLVQARTRPTGRMALQAQVAFISASLCPARRRARRQTQAGFAWAQQPAWPKSKESQCRYGKPTLIAAKMFVFFLFGLAVDAQTRHRPGLEARNADVVAAVFANPVSTIVNAG